MQKWHNPLSVLDQKEWNSFTVYSKSGAYISVLFAKAQTTHPKATIVLGHPMGKEAKGYFLKREYADLLRKNGYHTLLFDFNGFGESGMGNFSYYEDIIAAGKLASQLSPSLPIAYMGISLGGQWGILAFADPRNPYACAIIESAPTSVDEFCALFPKTLKVLKVLKFIFRKYARKIRMEERIKEVKSIDSLLLIYSDADEWTPTHMGARYLAKSSVKTELWIVAHAKHAAIHGSVHKDDYQAKIVGFFDAQFDVTRSELPEPVDSRQIPSYTT